MDETPFGVSVSNFNFIHMTSLLVMGTCLVGGAALVIILEFIIKNVKR